MLVGTKSDIKNDDVMKHAHDVAWSMEYEDEDSHFKGFHAHVITSSAGCFSASQFDSESIDLLHATIMDLLKNTELSREECLIAFAPEGCEDDYKNRPAERAAAELKRAEVAEAVQKPPDPNRNPD